MRNFWNFVLILTAATAFSCSSSAKKSDKQEESDIIQIEQKTDEEWEMLFDGKSIAKWEKFSGGEVTGWKIIDGELHNSGVGSDHGGDIITKKEYENFELFVEWKVSPQSNSGIFYHVQKGVTEKIYESGPEYQLIDGKGWPTKIADNQYTASNYSMQAPEGAEVKPVEEWNTTRIVVQNPHVEHWLNGKKVVEYELWSDEWKAQKAAGKWKDAEHYGMAKKGHIGLQDHGGLTIFRVIKIKEL
ncbi:DUF1080 domain-containing protein [Maribellus comscasis]|uniref:DUF1080 domain-containing protein n=1 Tax=Maribellus comscasis TaxID=2681766 RepID=A0A6I6JWU1_9BACT|nr:DUF1080 domain-containing protein [Maribellus comscasis]QGY42234.1 DUF1080 domain-containing protein [Maribellus comscasis]